MCVCVCVSGWDQNVTAVVVGDVRFRGRGEPHFLPGVVVTVGGHSATILAVLADVASVVGPVAVAAGEGGIDGVMVVFPSYNISCGNFSELCVGGDAYKTIAISNADGGVASCPPYCPGFADTPTGGVYYTNECVCNNCTVGPACLDPARASGCLYGQGDECRPCPEGGLCPGGDRLWCVALAHLCLNFCRLFVVFMVCGHFLEDVSMSARACL